MDHQHHLRSTLERLAALVLAGAGSLCISALSYFVYYYGWTGQRYLTGWTSVLLYFIAPSVLAVLLFASLRLQEDRKIRLALIVCSAGISIYAAEILLTVWFALPWVVQRARHEAVVESAKAQGVVLDMRAPEKVVDDLRAQGHDAVLSVYPRAQFEKQFVDLWKWKVRTNGAEILPLGGISNKLTVLCNESGPYVTFRSDEHGFNNPVEPWKAHVDIAAVGDSYVEGLCVPTDASLVATIRHRYPATIGLGMQGNGPLAMLATLKEYAAVVKPQVVLWFYFENDMIDLVEERTSPILMRYLIPGYTQRLFLRQADIDKVLTDFLKAARNQKESGERLAELSDVIADLSRKPDAAIRILKLIELRSRLRLPRGTTDTAEVVDQATADLLRQILAEAKKSIEQWKGRLYFVFLPARERYALGTFWPGREVALRVASQAGIPIIDLHPAFAAQEDPITLFPPKIRVYSPHYNEKGHRLVAEEVLRSISLER